MSQAQASPLPYPIGQQTPKQDLVPLIQRVLKEFELTFGETKTDVDVTVKAEDLLRFVTLLRDRKELSFDFLRNITGVDFGEEGMALKCHFYSFKHGHALQVTVNTPPGHPVIPSLTPLYPTANWHEREAHEMFGFEFEGHPNLKNLLLEEDLHIHPLLKAHPLQAAEILQGIESGPPGFEF
ncbi:MAG: NADH-quinone oxidoreductase subunit C [Hyphomicrobiales bacterium]